MGGCAQHYSGGRGEAPPAPVGAALGVSRVQGDAGAPAPRTVTVGRRSEGLRHGDQQFQAGLPMQNVPCAHAPPVPAYVVKAIQNKHMLYKWGGHYAAMVCAAGRMLLCGPAVGKQQHSMHVPAGGPQLGQAVRRQQAHDGTLDLWQQAAGSGGSAMQAWPRFQAAGTQ